MSVWGPTSAGDMQKAITAVKNGTASPRQVDVVREHARSAGETAAQDAIRAWDNNH